jgi:hypothetical protein
VRSTAVMDERESLFSFMPYGAPELKEVARKYMFRGVAGDAGRRDGAG